MSRRRQRQAPGPPAATGWQWRTFPVFFAFVGGAFVMGLSVALGETAFGILFLVSLAGMGFGLAHVLTRQIALRRFQRLRRGPSVAPQEEEEAEEAEPPPASRKRRRRRR